MTDRYAIAEHRRLFDETPELQLRGARTNLGLVAEEPKGEADQDRREGRSLRALCRVPDAEAAIPGTLFADEDLALPNP